MTGPEVTTAMKVEDVDAAPRSWEEYAPTTETVRNIYAKAGGFHEPEHYGKAFDRWLAQHDREIQAQALRDAAREPTDG